MGFISIDSQETLPTSPSGIDEEMGLLSLKTKRSFGEIEPEVAGTKKARQNADVEPTLHDSQQEDGQGWWNTAAWAQRTPSKEWSEPWSKQWTWDQYYEWKGWDHRDADWEGRQRYHRPHTLNHLSGAYSADSLEAEVKDPTKEAKEAEAKDPPKEDPPKQDAKEAEVEVKEAEVKDPPKQVKEAEAKDPPKQEAKEAEVKDPLKDVQTTHVNNEKNEVLEIPDGNCQKRLEEALAAVPAEEDEEAARKRKKAAHAMYMRFFRSVTQSGSLAFRHLSRPRGKTTPDVIKNMGKNSTGCPGLNQDRHVCFRLLRQEPYGDAL